MPRSSKNRSGRSSKGSGPSSPLAATLAEQGVRLTRQRRAVLRVISTARTHLKAETILERAQRLDPTVHRVTVYRTLELLKRQGLIDELDLLHLDGRGHYYETRETRDHLHFGCVRCGRVLELETELFERLKKQVEHDLGVQVTLARAELGGYCRSCRRR
jgi:Fur family ferric uptake transcriptional regulator